MRELVSSVVLVGLILAGCTSEAPRAPRARQVACPTDVELVVLTPHDCGYLVVPEDRADPGGPTIELFYLHVEPAGGAIEPDPIVSIGYELAQEPHYASIVSVGQGSGREFYLLDQRGTGHSRPSLACPEVDELAPDLMAMAHTDAAGAFRDAVEACRARLEAAGVHLDAYTVDAAAADLEDLRRALRVPEWNAISYGTASRVLLEYAEGDPVGARALVLDSPQFPQVDPVSEAAGNFDDALRALAEACRGSNACARSYPDMERAFSEATAALDRSPRSASVDGLVVLVDGAAMARVIRHLLSFNDWSRWGDVPRIVYHALDGDVKPVAEVLAGDPGLCIGYLPRCIHPRSLGAYLSFTCPDVLASAAGLEGGTFGEDDPYVSACDAWGSEASPKSAEPVATEVPALVLRGEYDGFSPLDLVQQAPATMPNAQVVLVPYMGHDVFGTYDCLREARNSWLADPAAGPSYERCLSSIRPPRFA